METLIVKYDTNNKAVKQVLDGLMKLGAISVEKSLYSEEFVQKIAKGDKDLSAGKGVVISADDLWK